MNGNGFEGIAVRLRPLRADDWRVSVNWRNDPRVRDYVLSYRLPVTPEMEATWVERQRTDQSRQRIVLGIEECARDALVGYAYLQDIDWIDRVAELGILLGERPCWGKGLGREAVALMLGYAFGTLDMERLWVRVAAYNGAALRLFGAMGFTREGELRNHLYFQGARHDLIVMGLLRHEWHASAGEAPNQ